MKNKRDIYLDNINSHNGKKNRKKYKNRREKGKTGLYIVVVLSIALILGIIAFYFIRLNQNNQDETKQAQEKLRFQEGTTKETDQFDETDKMGETDTTDVTEEAGETVTADDTEKVIAEVTEPATKEEEFMPDVDTRTPVKVKGIYVTGPRAGTKSYMTDLIQLVETTELNAMIIDIKNDSGEITYKMDLALAQEIGADINYIRDMKQLVKKLKAKDIYLIARIVAFKDPILAESKPELSLKKEDGTIFRDKSGLSWVNPYKTEVWDYLISIAKEAVELGFDEIQFDYIRFSTDSGMKKVDFGDETKSKTKMEVITEFTKYACEQLKPLGVYVSADVYGAIIDSEVDAGIVGQNYIDMSKYLDYICPMIYPSHYADGAYGIKYPDLEPYNLIFNALNKSMSVLDEKAQKYDVVVRPWLQDFSATWLTKHKSYGAEEIRAQIQAVYDAGYEEWILWNGNNNYTKEGLAME